MKVRKGGGEEIPLVQGKEQRLRFAGAAVKRYPMSEVRGSSRECQAVTAQTQPRAATPVQGQGWQPGGATSRPRPGAVAGRSNPTSKERWLRGRRRA